MSARYTISDVMTTCPYDISSDLSIEEARDMMVLKGIRNLPVVEDGRLVGILFKAAIDSALASGGAGDAISNLTLESPYIVASTEELAVVAGTMAEKKSSCALVQDEGKIVGIFTTTDACRAIKLILDNLEEEE